MSQPLLELKRLAVSFATDDGTVRAVDGIDLALARGRTLGLVGESGCGKSVTSLAVMGLLPSENSQVSGEVRFEGRDLLKIDRAELRDLRDQLSRAARRLNIGIAGVGWRGGAALAAGLAAQ